MKRKFNALDTAAESDQPSQENSLPSFSAFNLDARLLHGLLKLQFARPTPIQSAAVPLALKGKDLIARSKTGSGKTVAYVLPILQSILKRKAGAVSTKPHTSCLILVPTRELASQVVKAIESLIILCSQDVRVENITRNEDDNVQRARLAAIPDIVVATPGRAASSLNDATLSLDDIAHLVIDEADLILSYDYEQDLEVLAGAMPKTTQTILMSATLQTGVGRVKALFSRDPVEIDLEEEEVGTDTLSQYVVRCAEDEKFLLLYAIFMLKLIKGKTIVFVSNIDRCYRLKLFLEQFGIRSCVLNSELPVNSRIHVVEEFNKNVYNIIIATDEHEVLGDEVPSKKRRKSDDADLEGVALTAQNGSENTSRSEEAITRHTKGRKQSITREKDYGVARGIDFSNVACVLNFDLPETSKSYTHRIGRTARAGKSGMALSFIIPRELYRKHKPTSIPSAQYDEEVLAKIVARQEKRGNRIQPYNFDMKRLDGFRYRLSDALKAVTGMAIKQARVRELRQELIKSEKLKRHFEENPGDLQHLRHDGELRSARIQGHLKHVPDYLMSADGKKALSSHAVGFVGLRKNPLDENRVRKARLKVKGKRRPKMVEHRKNNPLQTFKSKRK